MVKPTDQMKSMIFFTRKNWKQYEVKGLPSKIAMEKKNHSWKLKPKDVQKVNEPTGQG